MARQDASARPIVAKKPCLVEAFQENSRVPRSSKITVFSSACCANCMSGARIIDGARADKESPRGPAGRCLTLQARDDLAAAISIFCATNRGPTGSRGQPPD
jgi:hypothetical protein